MSGLCIAGGGIALRIAAGVFTLSWSHPVAKTRWMERWSVEPHRLVLTEMWVGGAKVGVKLPPAARLEGRYYVWMPDESRKAVILRRDTHAGEWRLCADGRCAALGAWLKPDAEEVTLSPSAGSDCVADRQAGG